MKTIMEYNTKRCDDTGIVRVQYWLTMKGVTYVVYKTNPLLLITKMDAMAS